MNVSLISLHDEKRQKIILEQYLQILREEGGGGTLDHKIVQFYANFVPSEAKPNGRAQPGL